MVVRRPVQNAPCARALPVPIPAAHKKAAPFPGPLECHHFSLAQNFWLYRT